MNKVSNSADYNSLDNTQLISVLKERDAKIDAQKAEIEKLKLIIAMGKQREFGNKSESLKEEQTLFNYNEVEATASTSIEEELKYEVKPRKQKSKNHSNIDFESLVTETIIHKNDVCCESQKVIAKSDPIYKAEVIVDIKVVKHLYETAACSKCDIIVNPLRDHVFNNSICTPSLASYLINEKYTMGTPLYRQEQAFLDIAFPISRVDMSNWMIKSAVILKSLNDYLKELLINNAHKVICADETTLKVINVGNKQKKDKSYIWMYTTSNYDLPIYYYEYRYDRRGIWPREFLKDFKGYLISDDYAGYNNINPYIKKQACLVHARRKFFDIYKISKDKKIESIIKLYDDIFSAEAKFKKDGLAPSEIKIARNKDEYKNLFTSLFTVLENTNYAPNSIAYKAVMYTLNKKAELMRVLESGFIPIDNNISERGIKPFVINRKNFLFSNTEKGAEATCILMTIVQTAKANGLDPKKYIEHLLLNLYKPEHKTKENLDNLLPWNKNILNQFKTRPITR
jgi:transposase